MGGGGVEVRRRIVMATGDATAVEPAVTATTGIGGYTTTLVFGGRNAKFEMRSDQGPGVEGGGDEGPNPMAYLYAAIAGCTAMSVRGYAARKGMALESVDVDVTPIRAGKGPVERIEVGLRFTGDLSEDEKKRLEAAAAGCTVRKTIERSPEFVEFVREG